LALLAAEKTFASKTTNVIFFLILVIGTTCCRNCQSQDNTAVQRHSVLAKTANVKVNNIKNNQCHVILAVFV
jgi:hypothetical protein